MTTNGAKTIAFFGATGGCTLAALTHSLRAGYACRALVRTPDKLTAALAAEAAPTATLTVIHGTIDDAAAVASTVAGAAIVLFGIGGTPRLTSDVRHRFVTLDDPTVCQRGIAAVLAALDAAAARPLIAVVSSTGLGAGRPRDLPWLMMPLYRGLLHTPHADKAAMEAALVASGRQTVIVRPALLTDGPQTGRLRAGYAGRTKTGSDRWGDQEGDAIGYTISRRDVGLWLFEEVVAAGENPEWIGKAVSLAY